jgi:hypothetical protein
MAGHGNKSGWRSTSASRTRWSCFSSPRAVGNNSSTSNDQTMRVLVAMEFDRGDPARRCTAHRKNGDQCRKWAIVGGTVCATHGGAAKHVRNAARARIANAADLMAKQLLKMAVADDVSDAVKLAAIRDALDRAGLGARAGVDVEISTSPFEQIFTQVEIGSRADYRRSVGDDDTSDPPALADLIAAGSGETTEDDGSPLDVEVLSEHEYAARVAARPFVNVDHQGRHTMTRNVSETAAQRRERAKLASLAECIGWPVPVGRWTPAGR